MLTGHSPFRAETSMGVLNRICNDQPRPLRSIDAEVPSWLEAIVMRLLAKGQGDRFESAEEVRDLLEGCLALIQEPTAMPLPTPAAELARRLGLDHDTKNTNGPESQGGVRYPLLKPLFVFTAFAFFAFAEEDFNRRREVLPT